MATTLKKDFFDKFSINTPFFVETGTYKGEGIEEALKFQFKELFSIELHKSLYEECVLKFKNNNKIKLFYGDSAEVLTEIIKDLNDRITFWLDGHFSGDHTAKGNKISPILEELEQIKNHKIKNHTIIIDDLRYVRQGYYEMTIVDIINKIKEININYHIIFDNGVEENDILIAYI
jgi:hypothetical protein